MKKKTLNEELDRFKELCQGDPGMKQYTEEMLEKIRATSSFDELKKVMPMMQDTLIAFNPIEPLRSAVRKKLTELYDKEIDRQTKNEILEIIKRLKGPFKQHNIPDGAMI